MPAPPVNSPQDAVGFQSANLPLGFQTEAAFCRTFKRIRKVGPGTVRREARH